MTQLIHHMRDNGIRYGLQTMCEGGGMANATILELLDRAASPPRPIRPATPRRGRRVDNAPDPVPAGARR